MRFLPIRILCLAGVLAVAFPARGDGGLDPELTKYAYPPSVESLVTIDGVRIDGSPSLEFDMGSLRLGPFAEFSFRLVHRLETSFDRRTRSVWAIPELGGVIVPINRGLFRWRRFGADEVLIPAVAPGPGATQVAGGYVMQRTGSGDFVFRNRVGWEWIYRDWVLVSARGPNGLQLLFEVQGGLVTGMRATRFQIEAGNMDARYDDGGRLVALRLGNRRHEFRYDEETELLSVWVSDPEGAAAAVAFDYEDSLVSGVRVGDSEARVLRWERLPTGSRSDCVWPNAFVVAGTAHHLFSYSHDVEGYAITATVVADGRVERIVVNNHKGVVVRYADGVVVRRCRFGTRRRESSVGKLTRIEDGEENVTEQYEYDPAGRVARAWLAPDRLISFSYGPDGSLAGAAAEAGQPAP